MSTFIKPTPGRIVWYQPKPQDNLETIDDQPLAAILLAVVKEREDSGNSRVNLFVWGASGQTRYLGRVLLWQGGTDRPKGGYAEWMPYQLGQAAKAESLEKQLHPSLGPVEPLVHADPTKSSGLSQDAGTGG